MIDQGKLDELVKRGASIADFARAATDAATKGDLPDRLLSRCVVPRWIDRSLYDRVLKKGVSEAPSWNDFTVAPEVEEFGQVKGRYLIKEPVRSESLARWRSRKSELAEYSSELVGFLAGADPIDRLTAQILANPDVALAEFENLYREADSRFDLGACDSLLRILRNRYDLIDEHLRDALNDREQYLKSRSMFADDYWRTVAFIERTLIAEHFDTWQADPVRWVLHLHGKGGFGKTMFLRWLIARHCVVERDGKRIAVARVDSDLVDRASLSRWPWLALLPVAVQLNPQLPDSPFNGLLSSFGGFGAVLQKTTGHGPNKSRTELIEVLEPAAKGLSRDVPEQFKSGLRAVPVVIVIDTIEDLLLHYRAGLSAMLDLFSEIHAACPGMHLILCGRYNLGDATRLPKFMVQHCPPKDRVLIGGFSETESIKYLGELRGLPKDGRLGAIHRKTNGNPFGLALFADICAAQPKITSTEIERYPRTEYAYLIERIIDRIPPSKHAVAWLLRYAAIPRMLTVDFVQDVLWPHLSREMTSGGELDRRKEFDSEEVLAFYKQKGIWRKNPETVLQDVWRDLCEFASDNSWISLEHGVLNLQPEVRLPMRQLLRCNEIYMVLQKDAAEYFERRAKLEPKQWGELMSEALYHRFHQEGVGAFGRWKQCMSSAQASDYEVRACMASVPLSSDFVDERNNLVLYGKDSLVSFEALTEAVFEKAYSIIVERLRVRATHSSAQGLEEEFAVCCRKLKAFERHLKRSKVPAARRALIEGAEFVFSNRNRLAEKKFRYALLAERDARFRIVLKSLLARSIFGYRPDLADKHLLAAGKLAARAKHSPLSQHWIEFRRGRRLEDREEYQGALNAYQKAFDLGLLETPVSSNCAELFGRISTLLWKMGLWAKAEKFGANATVSKVLESNEEIGRERAITETRTALGRYDLGGAFRHTYDGLVILDFMLSGMVFAAAMNFGKAEEALNNAREVLENSIQGPAGAVVQKARLFLEGLGNPRLALETLDSIPGRHLVGNLESYAEHSLLLIRANQKVGREEKAKKVYAKLYDSIDNWSPRTRLRVLAHGLVLGLADGAQLREFLKGISAVEPHESRYVLLEPFQFHKNGNVDGIGEWARFRRSVSSPRKSDSDFGIKALLWAAGASFFGGAAEAVNILLEAYKESGAYPHLQRQIRAALKRAENVDQLELEPYLESYEREFSQFPNLLATMWIEEAEYIKDENPSRAGMLANRARERLQISSSTPSHWHVRLNALDEGPQRESSIKVAVDIASRIGERAMKEWVGKLSKGPQRDLQAHRETDLLARKGELRIVRTTEGGEDSIIISFMRKPGPTIKRSILAKESGLAREFFVASESSYAFGMVKLLGTREKRTLRDELRDVFGSEIRSAANESIGLSVEKGGLSSIPWEAAFEPTPEGRFFRVHPEETSNSETVRWVQSALVRMGRKVKVDGILGRETISLLRDFQGSPFEARLLLAEATARQGMISRARVLIIQADFELQREMKRGHGVTGTRLEDIYEKGDIRAEAHSFRASQELAKRVLNTSPSLIHIVSSFQESSRIGEILLSFGEGSRFYKSEAGVLSAGVFASILREVTRSEISPFVIVEAIHPPDQYEQARQLLLRNAFCSELFRAGAVRGVLGIGLGRPKDFSATLEMVVGAARRGESLGALHRELWFLNNDFAPPVLFTSDPDLPVLW